MAKKKAKKKAKRAKISADGPALRGLRLVVGANVARARGELRLSGAELSRQVGMNGSWVAGIESGRQLPPIWFLRALAHGTGRQLGDFFEVRAGGGALGRGESGMAEFSEAMLLTVGVLLAGHADLVETLLDGSGLGEPAEVARSVLAAIREGRCDAIQAAVVLAACSEVVQGDEEEEVFGADLDREGLIESLLAGPDEASKAAGLATAKVEELHGLR